ncbi:MAG: hypothetical protein AMXMBFR34_36440 [Myxococcaceae bacterium]
MRRLCSLSLVLLIGCGRGALDGSDAGDAARDAGHGDAGVADAGGAPDAGGPDAGGAHDAGDAPDAGVDAGPFDGGSLFGPDFDAGACGLLRPPPPGVASSPRGDGYLELLILHGAPWLEVVDEDTFARAERELAALRADGGPQRFIPTWGNGLMLWLDDAGTALLRARAYHEWDCLNWAWRGTPQFWPWTGVLDDYVFVRIEPVVRLSTLALDYAALPHVLDVTPDAYGICAACGCAADSCLDLGDGGTWTWLWYSEDNQCGRDWFRAQSEVDGGLTIARWPSDAGPFPRPWFDSAERCWDELWATQFHPRDGGP